MWTETRPIGYRFRPGAKATRYRVNMAFNSSVWVAVTNSFVGEMYVLQSCLLTSSLPKSPKSNQQYFILLNTEWNKLYYVKVLSKSLHLNGLTLRFCPQTQKLEPQDCIIHSE